MKKLQTETSTTGRAPANVHDQSGVLLGTATADWDAYRLWASGPSDTVEAGRVLSAEDIARLGLSADSSVFLLDAPEVELARQQPDDLDRYSALDRSIGRRITRSFGEWLEICAKHDQWHDENREATLENVQAFLDDYRAWEKED